MTMLFLRMKKVDEAKHEIVGWAAIEMPDNAGEIMDYKASKKHFEDWSRRVLEASHGKSLGNIRDSHTSRAVGKVIDVIFDDVKRGIKIVAKILDAEAWTKVVEGVFTGFSIGGKYGRVWPDPDNPKLRRYEAIPTEISLVDLPCIPGAVFEFVKSDGSSIKIPLRKLEEKMIEQITQLLIDAGFPEESAPGLAEKIAALMEAYNSPNEGNELDIEKEDSPAVLTEEDVKSIVMTILQELGLVSRVGDTLAMSVKADMRKEYDSQFKALAADLARLAIQVEGLERRGVSGPVLRQITGQDAAKAQQVEALRKVLASTTNPMLAQELQNQITRLEIGNVLDS